MTDFHEAAEEVRRLRTSKDPNETRRLARLRVVDLRCEHNRELAQVYRLHGHLILVASMTRYKEAPEPHITPWVKPRAESDPPAFNKGHEPGWESVLRSSKNKYGEYLDLGTWEQTSWEWQDERLDLSSHCCAPSTTYRTILNLVPDAPGERKAAMRRDGSILE